MTRTLLLMCAAFLVNCGEAAPGPDAPDGGQGDGGAELYSTVSVVMRNPDSVPHAMEFKMLADRDYPPVTLARWTSTKITLQPGETRRFENVYTVPRGAWNRTTLTVWEPSPENYSGRGYDMTLTTASATCIAEVWMAWPNAAFISCTND